MRYFFKLLTIFLFTTPIIAQNFPQIVQVNATDCWVQLSFFDQPVQEMFPTEDSCSDWFGFGLATAQTGVSGSIAYGWGDSFDACTFSDVSARQLFDGGNLYQSYQYIGSDTPEIEELIELFGDGHCHAISGESAGVSGGVIEYKSTTIDDAYSVLECGSESVLNVVGTLFLSLRFYQILGSFVVPIEATLGTTPYDVLIQLTFNGYGNHEEWYRKQHSSAGIYVSADGGALSPGEAETDFFMQIGGVVSLGEVQ